MTHLCEAIYPFDSCLNSTTSYAAVQCIMIFNVAHTEKEGQVLLTGDFIAGLCL